MDLLLIYCKNNDDNKIKTLIKHNRIQNNKTNDDMLGFQDDNGYSPLIWACIMDSHSVVKLLLDTGNAHPEYQGTKGDSALLWACLNNNTEIVGLLLSTGNAHPEYQSTEGFSALMLACNYGHDNALVVQLLLATGNAHPEYRNKDGKTAIDYDNDSIIKCICLYIKTRKIMKKIILIIKVVIAFKNYDKGKPYSCEMFYLMGLDGVLPTQCDNIDVSIDNKTYVKNKINSQQLKFMKLGYEEYSHSVNSVN